MAVHEDGGVGLLDLRRYCFCASPILRREVGRGQERLTAPLPNSAIGTAKNIQ